MSNIEKVMKPTINNELNLFKLIFRFNQISLQHQHRYIFSPIITKFTIIPLKIIRKTLLDLGVASSNYLSLLLQSIAKASYEARRHQWNHTLSLTLHGRHQFKVSLSLHLSFYEAVGLSFCFCFIALFRFCCHRTWTGHVPGKRELG